MDLKKLFSKKMIVVLAAFIVLALGAGAVIAAEKNDSDKISKNVFIGKVDVSDMTKEEAKQAVDEYIAGLNEKQISIKVENNLIPVSVGALGIVCGDQKIIEDAYNYGKSGNIVQRYKLSKDLEHKPKVLTLPLSVNSELTEAFINENFAQFNHPAVDGTVQKTETGFQVIEGTKGTKIDMEQSVIAISKYLSNDWDETNGTVELSYIADEPRGNVEELSKIQDKLGGFSTKFASSSSTRAKNVTNGAGKINGSIIYPGEEFSVYNVVSPFTAKNGYGMAGSYLNGEVVDSMGGGICQVSTTLYNAIIRAELNVTERSPHSMTVAYVKIAEDAAIAGTSKDLKFINNTDAPILIEGYTQGRELFFNIYGKESRPANRTIEFFSQKLSQQSPSGERITYDPSMEAGKRVVKQSARTGYTAKLFKRILIDGVEQSVEEVNKSVYAPVPAMVTVGSAPAAVPPAAETPAAVQPPVTPAAQTPETPPASPAPDTKPETPDVKPTEPEQTPETPPVQETVPEVGV